MGAGCNDSPFKSLSAVSRLLIHFGTKSRCCAVTGNRKKLILVVRDELQIANNS